jgi:hypothetical protein
MRDFEMAMFQVRPSVSGKDLQQYEDWNGIYGSFPISPADPQKEK